MPSSSAFTSYPGAPATTGTGYYAFDGSKYQSGSNTAYGASYTNGNIISILLDLDNLTVEFWKNGVSQGSLAIASSLTWHMAWGDGAAGSGFSATANFGAAPFAYAVPPGFYEGFGTPQ